MQLQQGTYQFFVHPKEQIHSSRRTLEPEQLPMQPCDVCGCWFLWLDLETMPCGHIYHPNCLGMHLQTNSTCNECGEPINPLWFESKGVRFVGGAMRR